MIRSLPPFETTRRSSRSAVSRMINPASVRSGATLTEVLMSLLIMSIGILSVMSLFPIALLRTIGAAQRTSAALLSENAVEEMAGRAALLEGVLPWQPNTGYAPGELVRPTPTSGSTTSDSNRTFVVLPGSGGFSSGTQPDWSILLPQPPNPDPMTSGAVNGRVAPGATLASGVGRQVGPNVIRTLQQPVTSNGSGGATPIWQEVYLETPSTLFAGPVNSGTTNFPSRQAFRDRQIVTVIDPLGWTARAIENSQRTGGAVNLGLLPTTGPPFDEFAGFGTNRPEYWNFGVGILSGTSGGTPTTWFPGLARLDARLRRNPIVMNAIVDPNTGQPYTRQQRLAEANNLVGSQDTFDEVLPIDTDELAVSLISTPPTGTEIALPRSIRPIDLKDFEGQQLRVVISNGVGTDSTSRVMRVIDPADPNTPGINATDSNVINIEPNGTNQIVLGGTPAGGNLNGAINPPLTFPSIGNISVQVYRPQFSFLVTSRKNSVGNLSRTVVVFFNRQLSVEAEAPVRASFGVGFDANGDGDYNDTGTAPQPHDVPANASQVVIRWDGYDTIGQRERRPPLKIGGAIFDGRNGHWYEIQRVEENLTTGADGRVARLTIGGELAVSGAAGGILRETGAFAADAPLAAPAYILPGVVRVFEQGLGE